MIRVILIYALTFLVPTIAHCELRTIGIKINKTEKNKVSVTIYSGVENENKVDIAVGDAAEILKNAKGSGSLVLVAMIVEDRLQLQEYKPLIDAISENGWLDLVGLRIDRENDMFSYILNHYEINQEQKD